MGVNGNEVALSLLVYVIKQFIRNCVHSVKVDTKRGFQRENSRESCGASLSQTLTHPNQWEIFAQSDRQTDG